MLRAVPAADSQRYDHSYYGHLFALLSNEKNVLTYFFTYDERNQFIFNRKEESLHLYFLDLAGDFQVDWKESKRILKGVVKIKGRFQSITK